MKRNYSNGILDSAVFFFGTEVEKTPAFGMKTLFVVGLQPVEKVENTLKDPYLNFRTSTRHIFFGANHSFNPVSNEEWTAWKELIEYFLSKDCWCSLDIPLSHVEQFLDTGLCQFDTFIPQIQVKIPYVKQWNYNTMVKIDDTGFRKTNPGIWTHNLHDLLSRDKFTNWQEYKNDEILK